MRWCQLKLGVLLLAAAGIFCAKADHVVDEPIVVTDSINQADEVFLGGEKTLNVAEPSLNIFNDPDEVAEVKDGFQQSIHLPYKRVSDTVYWDSIYGTDDIPEFDTPPEIEGDSIILKGIDEEVDDVDDVAFPFAKRSTDPRNLARVENDRETVDHRWNVKGKRSDPKGQTYRDDRSYWTNPFLPQYYEDHESPRFARQFESDLMIEHPEVNFRNDFALRDSENVRIMRESNRPMRTIPMGVYGHHPKYVPWLNDPETSYRSGATSAKAFAGSSRSNGGLSFVDGIDEQSDAYAKSKASSSVTIIAGGPRLSSGTSPVTGSSNYYMLDGSDSSKVISSSTASAISGENEKSISNYGYRRNVHLRPKYGMAHSHGVNLHKLSNNQPGCSCSRDIVIGDQGAFIVSNKKSNVKQIIGSQSMSSKAHASASSQVNLNQAVSAGSASGVEQNVEIEAGQVNDISVSQASVGAAIVEGQESQTEISRTIGTQETVSQSMHESAQASAASEHHESISASVTDESQISSANEGSVIPFVKDFVHLGSSIAAGAASAVATNVLDRTSSQTIGMKENVLSNSPCKSDVISGSELSTARSSASAMVVSGKIMNSNEEVVGSTAQSTAYVVNDAKSEMMNEESITNSATTTSQVVQEHQESIQSASASSQFESAGQTVVNSNVNTAAETGSAASHVVESSAQAAGSVLVKTGSTFVKPTSALIGSSRTVVAPHSVVVNPVPAVVGATVSLTNSAVGSLANVAQQIIRAKEGVINNIVRVPEHIVDSDLVSDGGCDPNPIDVIVDDVICEQPYPVNIPEDPRQCIGYDPRIGIATATNTFIGSNIRTGGQAEATLLTDKSVISSADASSRVSVASSGAAVNSVNVAGSIAESSAVAGSASAVEASKISLGSAVHSAAGASATAVAESEVSVGTSVHSAAQSSASAVQGSSVESSLTSSAHVISAEREIANDYDRDDHSVNVDAGAIVQTKENTATHSIVENVQQIHSSVLSQETHVAQSLESSASATSQVIQEHNRPVHVSDIDSCEDARPINIQQGTVFGAAAAASATSSATTGLTQSVVQNTEQVVTDRQSAIASSSASINAQERSATALVQETVGSSAQAGSEVILANEDLVQSGVDHVIVNANSAIMDADACESSLNVADQAAIASSNLHTGGHVIVDSNSGLANVHSHAVGSISEVSSQSTQIQEAHVQSAAHSISESVSSQSAASASAIASSAVIDQSVSSSAGSVKGHIIQSDDDCDDDSADIFYLGHALGNSQSQSRSQAFASAHSSVNSNTQSSSHSVASAKTEQVNVASAASASSQVVASEQDLIQSEIQSHGIVAGSNANVITSSTSINAPCDVADELIVGKHSAINSNIQDHSHSAIAISSASANAENSASVYSNTKSTDSSLHNNQVSVSSLLSHADSVASSVASSVAGSSVNSIAEAVSQVSTTKTVIDSTVDDVNQVVIDSQAVDADDCLSASAPMMQDSGIIINSESGIVKTASSSSAAAQSSSSIIESSSSASGVSSLSAQTNVAASAESVAGASVQNNVRMNSGSAHAHSASASRASSSQLDRNLYAGAYGYNYGRIPVQKTTVPVREIYIVENDPRNIKPVNIKYYGDECDDELEDEVDDDILESAVHRGSRLVEKVINDAAIEYNMNENTAFKEKIVDLAVKTVKKLVSDVASEAARKISNAEVATADSELEIDKSSISNSGFDFVDMRRMQKCPWRGNWKPTNLHDYDSHHNRPHLHRNVYRYPRYNNNGNRFVAEQRGRYRSERETSPQEGIKFERKFLDNLYFDGKIHHFQFTNQNVIPPDTHIDNNKLYNLNLYDNTRFIDLDVNCSDKSMCMTPECKRLDYSLKSPNEGNPIPLRFIKTHLSQGHDLAIGMHDRARWLVSGGFQPKPHTASMLHFLNNKVKDSVVKIHEESELTLFAAKLLQDRLSTEYNVTPNTFLEFLHNHGFRVTGSGICQTRLKRCSSFEKYRSYDGSCNNFHHPRWGQENTAFTRVVPPRYSDGIHKVPVSVTGDELPNVRELSVELFPHRNISNPDFTLALVQWGQVLSHDFAHQIMDQTIGGGIECCSSNGHGELPKNLQHHSCMPIVLSSRDKFYSKYAQRCMNFVRSMTVPKDDCTLGPAEQLNGATSYLDCSPMYGSDKNTCDSLRVFHGGLMKTEVRRGRQMMPTTSDRSRYCDITSPTEVCYKGGDVRVNQNPHLVILQTLLVREHNRVAEELSKLNPYWSDEQIFQETRRIVIAEYQHITYHEWLPIVLGKKYCKRHRLIPIESRMSTDYNSRVNPAVINGFTTAAFRFFHSMVDGNLDLCPMDRSITHTLRLSNHYFRPQIVERSNNFDDLVRGLITQPMMASDRYFDSELTEYLFRSRNEYGLDLEAIDIQRSRDHGLPGYNTYRKICQLKYAEDFDDLIGEIPREGIEKLRNLYAHVDDIDLLVGGSMETPIPGGILGPTIRCLVGEQFYRSRVSDRYFYDNANFPHSFTEEQYQEIRKASLARLICDTSDDLEVIQYHAFKTISWKNPLVSCCDIPKLNLTAWQE